MQPHVLRRRQLGVFRPRQPRNDINAGATPAPFETEEAPSADATPEERQEHYAKRCARQHLF